jgi:TIR domain
MKTISETLTPAPLTAQPSMAVTPSLNGDTASGDVWDLFLSHNDADKAWVTELAAQLESEPLTDEPDSKKIRVFLDIWDIQAGQNIVTKLNEGLAKSRLVAIIMSPEFFRANWTALEWTHCVAEDPRNTRGRIIPILHRDVSLDGKEAISLPAPFRALKHLDFRTLKSRKVFYRELLNRIRGLSNPRGPRRNPTPGTFDARDPRQVFIPERWKADHVSELLVSNLLPVVSSPSRIWSGVTTLEKPTRVYQQVTSGDGVIINGGKLYTFAHLNDNLCPLRTVVDVATVSDKDKRDEWLADKDRGRLYTWLLNSYLRKYLEEVGLEQDEKGRFFFPPTKSPLWTFIPSDFNDLPSLVLRLHKPADAVSTHIGEVLSPASRQALLDFASKGSHASATLRNCLAADFNNLISAGSLFEQQRFTGVLLRLETRELLSKDKLEPPDVIRLNRLLIEDAYPREILDARRVVLDGREVTGRKASPQPGQDFWVHWAAEIRLYRILDKFFLRIVPCFFFTHDGKNPLDGKKMGRLSIRWGGCQRNANILRDLIFWANFLRRGMSEIKIQAGAESIEIKPLPATARSSRGIRNDHIRFSRLMKFAADELTEAATDVQVTQSDEDENDDIPE